MVPANERGENKYQELLMAKRKKQPPSRVFVDRPAHENRARIAALQAKETMMSLPPADNSKQPDIKSLITDHYKSNFKTIVNAWIRRLGRKYGAGGARTRAEDYIQSGYLNALTYSYSFDPNKEAFDHWINKIVFNSGAKESIKDTARESMEVILDETVPDPRQTVENADNYIALGRVDELIEQEPERAREVLKHYIHDQWTYEEIAGYMGYGYKQGPEKIVARFKQKHGLT